MCLSHQGQVGGELAEHQRPMPALTEIADEFEEGLHLARRYLQFRVDESRMAGSLSQTGNLGQRLQGTLGTLFQVGDGLLAQIVVEGLFVAAQFHPQGDFRLFGQFVEHVLLGAPEQKG